MPLGEAEARAPASARESPSLRRSMARLDPPTFQLWACFKLIPVGLASRAVLGKRLSPVQWTALALLALGMSAG